MKKTFFKILFIFSVLILVARFGIEPLAKMLGYPPRAGLKVASTPTATVFINDKEVGQTPYQDENLSSREYKIRLSTEIGNWQGIIKLNSGTISLVNREIVENTALCSGEVFTLYPGSGAVITSTPNEADVAIDGKPYGKTPLAVLDLKTGRHTFTVSSSGFTSKDIPVQIPDKMVLNLDVALAASETNLNNAPQTATPQIIQVIVKQTPTGFLRVRNKPSLLGVEVGKVLPGENLVVLEELSGWFKVRLSDGQEGYISASYVQKQS